MSSYSMANLLPKISNNMGKAVLSSGYAYALDKYMLGEVDNNRSIMFAGVVFGGMMFEESIATLVKPVLPIPNFVSKTSVISGKKLVDRIAETLGTTAFVFIINKYLLRNDIYRGEVLKRMAVIAGSDMGAVITLNLVNTTSKMI